METRKIECDQCASDLTYTGNCEDYYLTLGNGSKAPWYSKNPANRGGFVTAMAVYPPVDRTHHFCGVSCLAQWIAEKFPKARESYERQQKVRERLAATDGSSAKQ